MTVFVWKSGFTNVLCYKTILDNFPKIASFLVLRETTTMETIKPVESGGKVGLKPPNNFEDNGATS